METKYLLENSVYDVDGIIMTTTDMFEGESITRYFEPMYVRVFGDVGENMTTARNMLAAKAKALNANAIVGLRLEVSQSSWTTGEFSGETYHDTGFTCVVYGTPVIVRFDSDHGEGNGADAKGQSEVFLSEEEKNGLFARRTIMEGLKGEKEITQKTIWKLLRKYPSGEYNDLVIDYCRKERFDLSRDRRHL